MNHHAPGLARVHALYEALLADIAVLDTAPVADTALSAEASALIAAEARLLDRRRFESWFALWEPDAAFWVPLRESGHPSADQSLLLDDHRRLRERVWRMHDTSAWALQPAPQIARIVSGAEAWESATRGEIVATSTILYTHERLQKVTRISGRQIHRLRRTETGWRIVRKILFSPDIAAGTPHLGWLL